MKKFLIACVAALMSLTVVFSGCSLLRGDNGKNGVDGKDGKDGHDVSIYEIYEAAKTIEGNEDMTFDEFLREYLSYTNEKINLMTKINYSLRSSVSIITTFEYRDTGYVKSWFSGGSSNVGKVSYNEVYVGSGVIVEMGEVDSYVVTNCHVIYSDSAVTPVCQDVRLYLYGQDADGVNYDVKSYYVTYNEKEVYFDSNCEESIITTEVTEKEGKFGINATVVGASYNYDIALLKVKTSDIKARNKYAQAAEFDMNEDAVIGETVYAVGFPGGEGMSATLGIISKESDYSYYSLKDYPSTDSDYVSYRVLRTDAAINGGNSGGALYNTDGKIAGIVCSKKVGEDYDNLGYALPASNVRRLWKLMRDNQSSFNKNSKKPEVARYYLTAAYKAVSSEMTWNAEKECAGILEKVAFTDVASVFPLAQGEVVTHITIKNGETVIEDMDVTRAYNLDDLLLSFRSGYKVYITTTAHTTPVEVTLQNAPYRV